MNRLSTALASLRSGRRGPVALAAGVLVIVVAGALVANPFGAPAPSSRPSSGPTAGQPTAGDTAVPSAPASLVPSVPPSQSALAPADLDGMLVDPALAHRLPIFVSIDDAAVARPQSGFNAASVVWQAPVDGYESRYLLVFQEMDAKAVGPVRSARFYFAHWAAELDAALAHYGGDLLTRKWIQVHNGSWFTNVDGIGLGNPAYHRLSSREAPHNAYTSTTALLRQAVKLGADPTIDPSVHLRPFRDDVPSSQYGSIGSITIPYSTETIRYAFDPTTDAYKRFIGSKAQIDQLDKQQVTARTIVVLYMPFHTDSTIEKGHNRPVLGFIGTGHAVVYSEGQAISATWSKPTETSPTRILGADGQEIAFVRGRIFFQVVPIGTKVQAS